MTRRLQHRGESPEPLLEEAVLKLWLMRFIEQRIWLGTYSYHDLEDAAAVTQWHSSLSPEAIDFLALMIKDAEGLEQAIRTTPSANSGYVPKGGSRAPNKINQGRLIRFIQKRWGVSLKRATNVVGELRKFAHMLLKYTE